MRKQHTQETMPLLRTARWSALACVLLLCACGGRYQAPLDDKSSTLERTPPPIYSTTGNDGSSGVVNSSAPSRNTSAAVSSGTVRINAGVNVQPAAGVSIQSAEPAGGITRRGISREPIAGSVPVLSAGASQAPVTATTNIPTTHIVSRGETLYSIAWQHSLDHRALAVANQLPAPYTIYPNQALNLNIGAVSNNAVQSVANVPLAPAGDTVVNSGARPAAAASQRRTGNVSTRQVEGITWQWPVEGRVLRGYAANDTATSRGIDVGATRGAPVYAAADGDVVYSGSGIQGQGDLIIIRHSARHLSAYSHNSAMLVTQGASILAGDKIGEVGVDAAGTPLIHFEVRVDGAPVDPVRFLPNR
jgi:lipoprotein NlpD